MEFVISVFLYLAIFWLIFKLGEMYGYFKVAKGLADMKEISQIVEKQQQQNGLITEKVTIEEIDGNYYAYVDNTFVGQGTTVDEAKKHVEKELTRKHKISRLELVQKE